MLRGHRVKTLIGLAITVALLAWVLRDVSAAEVLGELRRAHVGLLAAGVFVATASFLIRAFRWHVLLLPGFPHSRLHTRFAAVCIGFMVNNVMPARLGEFARAYSFARVEPIGVSRSLASVVVERAFDAAVLGASFVIAVWYGGFPEGQTAVLRAAGTAGGLLLALALIVLWTMARWPERTLRLVEHTIGRLLSPTLKDRAIAVLASFMGGLGALHSPRVFVRSLIWTIALWLCLSASVWLGLLAFDIREPGFVGAIFVQAVVGFAVAVPSSPGFFGPFEAATRLALEAYGVESVRIVSFATGYHILTFLPVTLLGFWYLHRLGIRWSEVEHSEELVEEAVEESDEAEPLGDVSAPGPATAGPRSDRIGTASEEGGATRR